MPWAALAGALPWCGRRLPPPAARPAGTPAQQTASLRHRSTDRGHHAGGGGGADPSAMPPTPHTVMLIRACAK